MIALRYQRAQGDEAKSLVSVWSDCVAQVYLGVEQISRGRSRNGREVGREKGNFWFTF